MPLKQQTTIKRILKNILSRLCEENLMVKIFENLKISIDNLLSIYYNIDITYTGGC